MNNDNDLTTATGDNTDPLWPVVTTDNWHDRIYDHGTAWCDRRDLHPAPADGYPGRDHYLTECRTRGRQFRDGLDTLGQPVTVEVYAARPFLFGQPRQEPTVWYGNSTRLILTAVSQDQPDLAMIRISLPIAETRNLGHHLLYLADIIDGHTQLWPPPSS